MALDKNAQIFMVQCLASEFDKLIADPSNKSVIANIRSLVEKLSPVDHPRIVAVKSVVDKLKADLSDKVLKDFRLPITYLEQDYEIFGDLLDQGRDLVGSERMSNLSWDLKVCLVNIRSSHNIGAMIRSAECFGVKEVILSGFTNHNPSSSMGSENFIHISECEDVYQYLSDLKRQGFTIFCLEKSPLSQPLEMLSNLKASLSGKIVVLVGHERHGVPAKLQKMSDNVFEIKMHGAKNSLNVSNALAVFLHHVTFTLGL